MVRVTGIRAVNLAVEDEAACRAFYRDGLGMETRPGALPGGTTCRWDSGYDQFVGLRSRDAPDRRWRFPYGRCGDWDHAELYLDGTPEGIDPVETHSGALVLADPEDRAIEALLDPRECDETPGIAAVGLSVVDGDRTRSFYERLGFEPDRGDGPETDADGEEERGTGPDGGNATTAVYRAATGQRWILAPGDRPGLHHVGFRVDPSRFRRIAARLPGGRRPREDRLRVTDPEGRVLVVDGG